MFRQRDLQHHERFLRRLRKPISDSSRRLILRKATHGELSALARLIYFVTSGQIGKDFVPKATSDSLKKGVLKKHYKRKIKKSFGSKNKVKVLRTRNFRHSILIFHKFQEGVGVKNDTIDILSNNVQTNTLDKLRILHLGNYIFSILFSFIF